MTFEELAARENAVHFVSVSGGKDSTATYCTALELLGPKGFRAVAADTGNENQHTYDQVNNLHVWTGGPKVEWVRADFTDRIIAKRKFIAEKWCLPGRKGAPPVDAARIARALEVLDDRLAHPERANPYLDMCLWKGVFPSKLAQFCTIELKVKPIQAFQKELLAEGITLISWQGVRAAESFERSLLAPLQQLDAETICGVPVPGELWTYRPLLKVADVNEVFAIAARHGVPRNRLYDWGASRVGCWPCVNCVKNELALVERHAPEDIERLARWEALVSQVSRMGSTTFMSTFKDPLVAEERAHAAASGEDYVISPQSHGIRRMVEWAKTDRGGRQQMLFAPEPLSPSCNAHGVCE